MSRGEDDESRDHAVRDTTLWETITYWVMEPNAIHLLNSDEHRHARGPNCTNFTQCLQAHKELGILGADFILMLPSCLIFRVVAPLDFDEFDGTSSSLALGFTQNPYRPLAI
jgi:hypothetical protein